MLCCWAASIRLIVIYRWTTGHSWETLGWNGTRFGADPISLIFVAVLADYIKEVSLFVLRQTIGRETWRSEFCQWLPCMHQKLKFFLWSLETYFHIHHSRFVHSEVMVLLDAWKLLHVVKQKAIPLVHWHNHFSQLCLHQLRDVNL